MEATRVIALCAAGMLAGAPIGYLWGSAGTSGLQGELAKTRAWLNEEIRNSDARHQAVEAELKKAQADVKLTEENLKKREADLGRVVRDLNNTRAMLKDATADWRAEQLRRRGLQAQLAASDRDCGRRSSRAEGGDRPGASETEVL